MNAAKAGSARIIDVVGLITVFVLGLWLNQAGAGSPATRIIAAGAEAVGFVYVRRWLGRR